MSQNLDLVRSLFAAWQQSDWSPIEWADPQIEFVLADGPDPRTMKGLPAMAAFWREFLTAWTGYGVQADEIRELSAERVFVVLQAVGRGRTSGVELGQTDKKGANVFHISAGKVTRLVIYFDHAHALDDLGLAE
jgi:ketosteroid isomerase-like protein